MADSWCRVNALTIEVLIASLSHEEGFNVLDSFIQNNARFICVGINYLRCCRPFARKLELKLDIRPYKIVRTTFYNIVKNECIGRVATAIVTSFQWFVPYYNCISRGVRYIIAIF